jgi:hypothetical protein
MTYLSRYFRGRALERVEMSNIDMEKILPKVTDMPYRIMKYGDLKPDMELPYWTVLLYQYPGQIGHWVLIRHKPGKQEIYFIDPYGLPPDHQWSWLENPQQLPEPRHVLTEIIKRYVYESIYKFRYNKYNIQGTIRNGDIRDSECGEIVILRIIYEDLSDYDFAVLCESLGGHKIFEMVSKLSD